MRTTLLSGWMLAVSTAMVSADEPDRASPLRVYFVGNSVTDTIRYDALEKLAASQGRRLTWGRHMIPGAPLGWIWEHPGDGFTKEPFGYYPQALSNHEWDVLSLQPFDRLLEGEDGDVALAKRYIDLARKKSPDLTVLIYSRWPRRGGEEPNLTLDYEAKWLRGHTGGWDGTNETRDYFERLVTALREEYAEAGVTVRMVPVGDVLLELDRRAKAGKVPGLKSVEGLYVDGIHFGDKGAYVVGLTYYATLYGADPAGLPSAPYEVNDAEFVRAAQEAVWHVVKGHPFAGVKPE